MAKYAITTVPATKLAIDADFVASHTTVPALPQRIFRQFAPDSGMSLLSRMQKGFDAAGIGIKEEGSDKSVYSWRITDDSVMPTRVVGNASVPVTPVKAGIDFDVRISKSHWILGATFLGRDQRTLFMATGKDNPSSDGSCNYRFQVVGNDDSRTYDVAGLLSVNSPLNFNSAKVGEASSQGQEYETGGYTDYFQTGDVHRSTIMATGHGITADNSNVVVYDGTDNAGKRTIVPLLALGYQKTLMSHLKAIHHNLFFSVSNWNPITKTFANRIGTGPRADRPSASGFLEIFESSTMPTATWSPSTQTPKQLHDTFIDQLSQLSNYWRLPDTTTYIALTWGAGRRVLNDVFAYARTLSGVALQQQITDPLIDVGVRYNKYTTVFGTVVPFDMGWGSERTALYDQTSYSGVNYNAREFDIFLVPVVNNSENSAEARPNVRVVPKVKDGINRALVFGVIPGMTGLKNSMPTKLLDEVNAQATMANFVNSQYQIGSPVDAEIGMFLSDLMPVCENPDMIAKIEHSYQPSWV